MSRPIVEDEWHTVPPRDLEELLLLGGYAFELRDGRRTAATRDLRRRLPSMRASDHDPGEFVSSLIEQGLRGNDSFWRTRYVATGRKLVADLWQAEHPSLLELASLPPRAFRVDFSRTFNLDSVPSGSPVRLRIPLPIQDAHLTDLTIAVATPQAEIRTKAGRIEAKISAAAPGPFTVAASFSFTAHAGLPLDMEDNAPDLSAWLSDNEGPIQVTERVRTLAARLAREALPPFEQVVAFRDYIMDNMICGMIHSECLRGPAGMDWILDNRWFDCRNGSALLVALCRAQNIPARLIGGYLLWNAPTEHYWIEAWLPESGWTPFDLLAWDLSAGGRDEAWRDLFAGVVDYRMKTQIFPHLFTGTPGVPMVAPWHRLVRFVPDGAETRYISIPHGNLFYADQVRVFRA